MAIPASAQDLSSFERRTHLFRIILNKCGLTPVASLDEALAQPGETVIIMLGPCPQTDHRMLGQMEDFIREGGALLVASDHPLGTTATQTLGVDVTRPLLKGPADRPGELLRGTEVECPLLRFDIPPRERARDIPFAHLRNIATNRPSALYVDPQYSRRRVMALLPPGCRPVDRPRNFFMEPLRGFAVGERWGAGKYMVLADHSPFINLMLSMDDNDNYKFAVTLTDWLTDNGRRGRVLFVEEDTVRTDLQLDPRLLNPALPHPDVMGSIFDRFIHVLERENAFNDLINRLVTRRVIVRTALLAASVLALAYALWRMTAGRWRIDARSARLPERVEEMAGAASAAELRRLTHAPSAATLAAQELARRTFDDLGVGGGPPQVVARRRWVRAVARLWAIAAGGDKTPLSPARLEALADELHELRLAVARGEVRLQPA